MLLILGTKSSLLMFPIHSCRTPWSWARPGNPCKPYGLRHGHWSWSKDLCMTHWVCCQIWSFPLLLEEPTTAQLLTDFLDIPRRHILQERCEKIMIFLRWGFIQTRTCRTRYFTFWLQSANRGSAAVIHTVIRVRRLSLNDETQHCSKRKKCF